MNKLYYDSAYIKEFEAQVLSCQEGKKGWRSPSCHGVLPGGRRPAGGYGDLGNVRVTDVHEKDGQVVHYTDGPRCLWARWSEASSTGTGDSSICRSTQGAPGIRPVPPAVRL